MILKIIRENGKSITYHRVKDWNEKDGIYTILQGREIYNEKVKTGDKIEIISEVEK